MIFFGSGAGNPLLSRLLVSRLEQMTGGKVELRALSIQWLARRATIKGLVIHGREPAGTEPLFTAKEVQAALRIDSIWGRRISLDELDLQQNSAAPDGIDARSEEHTSELQSPDHLVCRVLLEKNK